MSVPVVIKIGEDENRGVSHEHMTGIKIVEQPDTPAGPTYYAAINASGEIVNSVQISGDDRMSLGVMVGNWIASGLAVHRMTYKAFRKAMDDAQKKAAALAAATAAAALSGISNAGDAAGSLPQTAGHPGNDTSGQPAEVPKDGEGGQGNGQTNGDQVF